MKWIFKSVVVIRIGYTFCRARFELKTWVGLPDLENENRGHLVKFGFISALLRYNWQIKIVCLRSITWCFPVCIHCEIITTVKLINISVTTFGYHFSCVVRTLTYPFSKFQVYNTVCKPELPGGLKKKKILCLYVLIIGLGCGRVFYKTSPSNFNAQHQLRS